LRQLSYIFGLILTVILVVFAIDNGAPITISLWPLPWQASLPGFIALFLALLLGFLVGAAAAWLSGSKTRKRVRDLTETSRAQAHQIAEQERRYAATRTPTPPSATPVSVGTLPRPR
jgi:putative membrane protein